MNYFVKTKTVDLSSLGIKNIHNNEENYQGIIEDRRFLEIYKNEKAVVID